VSIVRSHRVLLRVMTVRMRAAGFAGFAVQCKSESSE